MRAVFGLLLIVFTACKLNAQLASAPPTGPRALGMGSVSVTSKDAWSLFNNPGGLAELDQTSALFAYRTIFDFSPFNTVSAGSVIPTTIGTAGISVFRFGDDEFNSQMLSGMFSHQIGIISLGLRANYLQFNIEGFGRKAIFVADIGAIAKLSDQLSFGVQVTNFTQSSVSDEDQERVPTIINIGLSYEPTSNLFITVEGEKDVDLEADLKIGVEYKVLEKIFVRTGFTVDKGTHSFGAGIELDQFFFDYGIKIDQYLGNNHNLGLIFTFPNKR
jgi:hypothetical protein